MGRFAGGSIVAHEPISKACFIKIILALNLLARKTDSLDARKLDSTFGCHKSCNGPV